MILALTTVVVAGLLLETTPLANPPAPLVQLIQDLDTAISGAHLTDVQTRA